MVNLIFDKKAAKASLVVALSLAALPVDGIGAGKRFYSDDPLWTSPAPEPATNISARKLNEYYDFFQNTMFQPGERAPEPGIFLPSQAVNTVDEVPDSAWFTNRRGMTVEELRRGPGDSHPPAEGRWTVVAAKNEGVTPGFRIRDEAGRQYLIKFDPLSNPEMASAADVISSKFFYALGYNVPENYIATFERRQFSIADGSRIDDGSGRKRPLRERDIDEMLAKSPRMADGRYRVLASLLVPGKLIGPFKYYGTRSDDPNDLVPHEHRRDLRALRTFCSWLGHDDSKSLNTIDTLLEENGIPFVRHYLIDFGASLGSASFEANSPRDGNTYLFSWKSSAAQFVSLGLYVPRWQRAKYPVLPAAGRFEYEVFDPERWVPNYPNPAFRNENPSDRLWAARKIAAFTDAEIRAIVAAGQYSDPAAAEWVIRCLIERRNKIANVFLRGAAALDGFEVSGGTLKFRNGGDAPVRIQWSVFDNHSGQRRPLSGGVTRQIPRVDGAEYLVADIGAFSDASVAVYVSLKNHEARVVGVERQFTAN